MGVLTILGVIGFVMRLSDGVGDKVVWGYYAAMFSFMLTTASGGADGRNRAPDG